MTKALCALLLLLTGAAQAQSFGPPVGENAAVTPTKDGLAVSFQPAEWPHVMWSASAGKSWDWRGHATLAFEARNPGREVVDFNVRIDDDPKADGVLHCHTASASLGADQSGTFFVDLAAPDPKATMGMNGGPPAPGLTGMTAMTGSGVVDVGHITAFQVFLHKPAAPRTLRVSRLRLLPTLPVEDLYKGIVDRFGQYSRADWPGKLHSAADFGKDSVASGQGNG